jgi:drug/metabolite transporter (DMT)-like permease
MGGVAVGLAGVAVLLVPAGGGGTLEPWGIGLLLLANIGWAAGSIYARHGPMPSNGLLATGMEQLAGGGTLVLAALVAGEVGRVDLASVSVQSWVALAYLVVFGSLLAFTAYTWLLKHVPMTTVATYAYVNPIVAVALGVALRGEQLTPRTLLAAALIIGAVVAMVSGRPRQSGEPGVSPEVVPPEPA